MMLRQPSEEALLTGQEIALVRQALAGCAQVLARAQDAAGPAGALLAEATQAATAARRSPGGMLYYINLAIDYPGFAPAARRRR